MTDTPTPRTMEQLQYVLQDYTRWQLIQRLGQAERDRDTAERETVELRQQLAALEQKRREDVRKCEKIMNETAEDEMRQLNDSDRWQAYLITSKRIRAAFPDVFKESSNG